MKAALAHKKRGFCFTKIGKRDEAIKDFQEALWLDPNVEDGRLHLAVALFDQEGPDENTIKGKKKKQRRPLLAHLHSCLSSTPQ